MRCTKLLIFSLLVSFVYLTISYSQSVKTAEKKKNSETNTPPAIEIIVNDSYYVPAEFAVEILFEASKLPGVSNSKKKDFLLKAYSRLDEIQQPVRKKLILSGISTDNRQNLLSESFGLKLDAVSLGSKIIKELLKFDKKKVREIIFQNQPEFSFQPVSCDDALDYKIEDFYETLTAVAKETFTTEEKKRNIRLLALTPYVQNIKSPKQIVPIGKMLLSLDLTATELSELILSYSAAVREISAADRSFFNDFSQTLNTFDSLLKLANDKNAHKEILTDSFRGYIAKNFRAEKCADNEKSYEIYSPLLLKWVNENKFAAPLSKQDTAFEEPTVSATIDDFWKTDNSRQLLNRLKNLRFNMSAGMSDAEPDEPTINSKEDKQKTQWKEVFAETLSRLGDWNGENEKSEALYFHQKCILYHGLIEIAGEDFERVKVLENYEKFLSNTNFQKENRMEWFFHSSELIKLAKKSFKKENDFEFRLLSNSKNPVFRIYADLIKLQAEFS